MKCSAARHRLIRALQDECFEFEYARVRAGKNLLQTGEVSPAFVIDLLKRCSGNQYIRSPHHADPLVECHIFKPETGKVRWCIKCYFLDANTVLICVHVAEY